MEIELTKGKFAIVDDSDWYLLSSSSWSYSKSGYAVAKVNKKIVFMHRIIMGEPNCSVDHINGNTLDNRRNNLRLASHSQNTKNRKKTKNRSSKFKGVDFQKRSGTWRARIKVEYRSIYLGQFSSEVEAARAYNKAALIYFGEFARLNNEGDF